MLSSLRDLGVEIALDDFGTGYSSLSYLRQLPVTAVKIDQRFVAGIGGSLADEVIVEAVIDLAHALGLRVVAEGVEHVGQADALVRMGADTAQGYHFARPMPPEDARAVARPAVVRRGRPDLASRRWSTAAPTICPGFGSPRARLLLAALDTAHDSVVVTTAGGDGHRPPIVYVNDAFLAETGLPPSDVIGRTDRRAAARPARPCRSGLARSRCSHRLGAGDPRAGQPPRRRLDVPVRADVSPISDERGVAHALAARSARPDATTRRRGRARPVRGPDRADGVAGVPGRDGRAMGLRQRRAAAGDRSAARRRRSTASTPTTCCRPTSSTASRPRSSRRCRRPGSWSGETEFVDPVDRCDAPRCTPTCRWSTTRCVRARGSSPRSAATSREMNALARAEQRRRELGSFAAEVAHGAMHRSSGEFLDDLDGVLDRFGRLIGADRVNVNSIDMEAGTLRSIAAWSSERYPTGTGARRGHRRSSCRTGSRRLQQGGVATFGPGVVGACGRAS